MHALIVSSTPCRTKLSLTRLIKGSLWSGKCYVLKTKGLPFEVDLLPYGIDVISQLIFQVVKTIVTKFHRLNYSGMNFRKLLGLIEQRRTQRVKFWKIDGMADLLVCVDDQDHDGFEAGGFVDGNDAEAKNSTSGDSLEVKKTEGKQKSWPAAAVETS